MVCVTHVRAKSGNATDAEPGLRADDIYMVVAL